jgi:mono/diheme cytochrome c family protein
MPDAVSGVIALFSTAEELVDAIPEVRARGFESLEAFTPYPVHGLDKALKLKRSWLPALVMIMGGLGAVLGFLFEWWTSAVNYPLHIGGKPLNSWQAFVPVMFEVTVLFATFTAGLGMLFIFNKLPFFGNPILDSDAIKGITRDKFALMIQPVGGALDVDAASAALVSAGGSNVEVVMAKAHPPARGSWWVKTFLGILVACVVAGYGTSLAIKIYPTIKPMVEMEDQAKLDAQKADGFFKDGHGMQLPPEGTVPRGYMPILAKTPEEAGKTLFNPLPITAKVLARGRTLYDNHCAVCHGFLGRGKPLLDKFYQASPANLQSKTFRDVPDGYIYDVISKGKGAMPSYEADISSKDRWAIIHYVRALQRSQHAREEDLQ